MFIETRFFDNGSAEARLSKTRPEPPEGAKQDRFDYYVDEIDDLGGWIEDNLEIELDDITDLVLSLDTGGWVSITDYI
jgi:hypothetical protein